MTRTALVDEYSRLVYHLLAVDIITSRMVRAQGLAEWPRKRWGVMALTGDTMADFSSLDWKLLADDPTSYDEVDGFFLVGSGEFPTPDRKICSKH